MSEPVPGYTGRVLRVDLTQRQLREEKVDEATLRKYLGGMGLGARYLYDEVNPEINWDDPANRLILASGPLGGTIVDGTGCFSITTKGPITNGAGCSQANGFFGAFLKFSGFDAIVVQGQAPDWVYLYVHDGVAELCDARRLVGKDTWETEDLIKEEIGKTARQASVCCIGPAGENRVKFAAIVSDKGHVAGHNGMGAVMGAKRLKAIAAARGKPRFAVKDRERLAALAKEVFAWRIQDPQVGKKWFDSGTTWIYGSAPALGQLPVKNLTTSVFPESERFTGAYYRPRWKIKPNPCWACRNHHCYLVEVTEGPYAGFKGEEGDYEVMAAFGSLIGQTDAGAATMLANECDKLGLEGIEAGWLISWLIECYERGLITRKQADGLPMNWGNVEAVRAMLGKISRREGFGDFLAEGIMRCCERMGGEARDCGVYLKKGTTPRSYDVRSGIWSDILDEATTPTGFSTDRVSHLEELGLQRADPYSPEEFIAVVAAMKGKQPFYDSLVICAHATGAALKPYVEILNAVTGWDFTLKEALDVGLRSIHLLRAFDIRSGVTPEGEMPSARLGAAPTDGPAQGKSIMPYWSQMLDSYYRHMGWDRKSGKPLPDTLRSVGLGHLVADLWGEDRPQRG